MPMRTLVLSAVIMSAGVTPLRHSAFASSYPRTLDECSGCVAGGGGPANSSQGNYSVSIIVTPASGACVAYEGGCAASGCSAAVARGWSAPGGTAVSQCETQYYSNGSNQTYCLSPTTVAEDGTPGSSNYNRRIGCGNSTTYTVEAGPVSASIGASCSPCTG
jgi:hypothetical protein